MILCMLKFEKLYLLKSVYLTGNIQGTQEMQVLSLGWEVSLEKEMANHSTVLAWKISQTEEPGGPQPMEVTKSWTQLSMNAHACIHTHTHTHTHILHSPIGGSSLRKEAPILSWGDLKELRVKWDSIALLKVKVSLGHLRGKGLCAEDLWMQVCGNPLCILLMDEHNKMELQSSWWDRLLEPQGLCMTSLILDSIKCCLLLPWRISLGRRYCCNRHRLLF